MYQVSTWSYILGMAVYYGIFFFITALILAKLANYIDDTFIFIIAGLLLFFIAAFRLPGIDKDSLVYITAFESFKNPLDYFTHHQDWFFYEPFYYLIPSIAKFLLGKSIYVLFVFVFFAAVSILLTFNGIKKLSALPELSLLLYFSNAFLMHEMTQIRAGVACGLFLFAIYYHYEKKYRLFALVFFIGMLFHYTSILMLLILLINPHKFNIRLYISVALISVVLALFGPTLIIESVFKLNVSFVQKMAIEFGNITTDQNVIHLINIVFLLNVSLITWLFIHHKKLQERWKYSYLLLKIHAMSIVSLIIFSSVSVIAVRVSEFLGIVTILSIPLVVYTFRSRLVGYGVVFGYSLMAIILTLQFNGLLKPYKFIF